MNPKRLAIFVKLQTVSESETQISCPLDSFDFRVMFLDKSKSCFDLFLQIFTVTRPDIHAKSRILEYNISTTKFSDITHMKDSVGLQIGLRQFHLWPKIFSANMKYDCRHFLSVFHLCPSVAQIKAARPCRSSPIPARRSARARRRSRTARRRAAWHGF